MALKCLKTLKCLGFAGAFFVWGLLGFSNRSAHADTLIAHSLADQTLRFIALPSGKEVARRAVRPYVYDLYTSPDGRYVSASSFAFSSASLSSVEEVMQQVFDVSTATLQAQISSTDPLSPNVQKIRRSVRNGDQVVPHPPGTLAAQYIPIGRSFYFAEMLTNRVPPELVAFSQHSTTGFAVFGDGADMTVLDIARNVPLRRFPLVHLPQAITLSPDDQYVWVASNTRPDISLYRSQTGQLAEKVSLPALATRLINSPDKRWVVAAHYDAGSLSIIDRASRQTSAYLSLELREGAPSKPASLLFDAAGTRLFVSLPLEGRIVVFDALDWSLQTVFDAGLGVHGLALSPIDVSQ